MRTHTRSAGFDDGDEPGLAAGTPRRPTRGARLVSLGRPDGDGLHRLETVRDVGQRPVELSEQIHDAAEGFGHRAPFSAQGIELALKGAVSPAQLTQLSPEPLALLLSHFERAPQAVTLVDQRWDHVAELILAFR